MSISEQDRQQEQQRIERVRRLLQKQIEKNEPEVSDLRAQVVDIRTNFWDDVTVNIANSDDQLETAISMKQQAEILSERERSHRHLQAQLKSMKRLLPSPYFGRIDFKEKGDPSPEQIYIGVSSFYNEEDDTFLVYDWRTPVASLYYDYPPGPARYETPSGTIGGEITLKRQYLIRDGELKAMFDTGVTIGDELLQQVLGKSAGTQMQSIVATIQQEQNRIIRNDRSKLLVVQGAAGSGKTSAALQRVAYLLYKHREHLSADRMVLFSPNPMFNSYISSVLPELGEENIRQTTFQDYLEHRLGKQFQIEDPFQQMEYRLNGHNDPGYEARMSGIRYKNSELFLDDMLRFGKQLEKSGMMFKSVRFRSRTLITQEEMRAKFYSYDASIRLPNRVELMKEWLLAELKRFEVAERSADWVRDEMDYLDNEQYQRAYVQMRKRQGGHDPAFDDALQEEQMLREVIVRHHFKPLRRRIKRLAFIDYTGLYLRLFSPVPDQTLELNEDGTEGRSLPGRWNEICAYTKERLGSKELPYEDAAPLLYLRELVEGFNSNTNIRYVLIDEAQDYSPFQFEFLKRLFPFSRMTALGDFNQGIFPHSTTLVGSSALLRLYGEVETENIVLTRSYRSTREIVEFTRAMLPGGEAIEPFQRDGGKPVIVFAESGSDRLEQIRLDILKLNDEGFHSIAVICKSATESAAAFEELRNRPGLDAIKLVTRETPTFSGGFVIIPAYLAKGVEFDAVLIYDASAAAYDDEGLRKLFYTACTRAMHRLRLYTAGELTRLAADVDSSLYDSVTLPANPMLK
ncbi:RNA polymerase recycling motor HelD [Paenibacillus beijingensis]|uniref:Helicase n=1 Tax=Paenibacillus beijingensis TaxID=1126833 RepID=A0A0D5NN15_9BACL|nr:RNA polymerase recycling motor HelD [Paenibacillus beijingensis]AJY76689.1 helicase [Paenibacillus beijingensis]